MSYLEKTTAGDVAGQSVSMENLQSQAFVKEQSMNQQASPTRGTARPAKTVSRERLDARGCPVSTHSAEALDHAEIALWRMVSYFGDALADLDQASAADPQWVLPHVMRANLLLTMTERQMGAMAAACIAQAAELVDAGGGNERERRHLHATRLCAAGQWRDAGLAWDALLLDYPQDLVALLMGHLFDFFRGDARNLRQRVARVLPDWSASAPLYSYVLGMHAFGLEECNLYPQAQDAGRAALAAQPKDPWAIHAVTHTYEMLGQPDAGADWLTSRQGDWSEDNAFAYHNWWHLGLFNLERGDTAQVLSLLDERITPGAATALQRLDVTAMLWRLKLTGVDVGERWKGVSADWRAASGEAGYYAFNDLHAMLAHIGDGDFKAARQVLAAAQAGRADASSRGQVTQSVGVPLLQAMLHYGEGAFARATEELLALRDQWVGFGGSHAQRDLLEQTLLDAAIRSGQHRLAKRLFNERVLVKPKSVMTEWWGGRVIC